MKNLLIILSILLLSSPVIGDNHKGETLYRWETSSGKYGKDLEIKTLTVYIKVNGRMGNIMVKGHSLGLMETSM